MKSTIDLTMERIFRDKEKQKSKKKRIPWKNNIEIVSQYQSPSMTISYLNMNDNRTRNDELLEWYISPSNTTSNSNYYTNTISTVSYELQGINRIEDLYSTNGRIYGNFYITEFNHGRYKSYSNYNEKYNCKGIFKKYRSFAFKMRETVLFKKIPWLKNNSSRIYKEIPWRFPSYKKRHRSMMDYSIYLSEDFIPFSEYMENFQTYKNKKGWFSLSDDKNRIPWTNYQKGKKNPLNSWNLPEEYYDNYDDEIMPRDTIRSDGSILYI